MERRHGWERADFLDEKLIADTLEKAKRASVEEARDIVQKGREAKGLTLYETAVLLHTVDGDVRAAVFAAAREVKEKIYGKRLVFFAPLYISNYCTNNCVYCGYRRDNTIARRKLGLDEMEREVIALETMGHKRIALEVGEDPVNCPLDYVIEAMGRIYSVKEKMGSIRRINVNIAATTVEEYRRLKAAGIGTYILFQETYHRETYGKMHPAGRKRDYDWHTMAMDRAMEAGMVWVNCYKRFHPGSPFGGLKDSGYGREMGHFAMHEYTEPKSVWVNFDAKLPVFYPR